MKHINIKHLVDWPSQGRGACVCVCILNSQQGDYSPEIKPKRNRKRKKYWDGVEKNETIFFAGKKQKKVFLFFGLSSDTLLELF